MAKVERVNKQCPVCNSSFSVGINNKLKIYCSNKCGDKVRKPRNPVIERHCVTCSKEFATSVIKQKYCSSQCRYQAVLDNYVAPEPRTHFEYQCDWCAETIVRNTPLGGIKRYHPECSKKAETARMRIKTVKRQGVTNPKLRMCHEDLLERDGNICYLCNEPIDYEKYRRSYPYGAWIDHVIPIDAIGAAAETMENMRLTHGKCNRAKWATPLEEYLAKSR